MSINNNIPYGNDQVDTVGYNPQITKDYLQQEQAGTNKAIDDGRPSINPQPYCPEGGQIISDEYFNHSNLGIHQVNSYSVNNTDEWEAQVKAADLEALGGRTIYNTFPTKSVMPNIVEPPKPTQERLAQVHKEALVNSLTQKIKRYQSELAAFQMKVINAEIGLKKAKDQLSELEDS